MNIKVFYNNFENKNLWKLLKKNLRFLRLFVLIDFFDGYICVYVYMCVYNLYIC